MRRRALLLALATALSCALPEGPPRAGSQAPDLLATTLAGDTLALASFRGRPLVLNLWATWCAPCRRETPYLQSLHETYRDRGLEVVGVTVDTRASTAAIRAFLDEFGVTYTILHDPDMLSMDRYGALGLPTTILVDREGIIRLIVSGPVSADHPGFEEALRHLLD